MNSELKSWMDGLAVVGSVSVWFEMIPNVAAILSIIWLALRIWETKTVQGILRYVFGNNK